jgi:glutamate--cysteine ligase
VTATIQHRLQRLTPSLLADLRRGLEKESLRVAPDGMLAMTPHPAALGSALTHPAITTDFCEAQPELVTGVHGSIAAALDELTELHRFVLANIGDELLWSASMPCRLPADDAIPVAQYGSSNMARIKTVYRLGLGHRYGRRMQTISGIHYNFSLSDRTVAAVLGLDQVPPAGLDRRIDALKTDLYFGLIRNFRRNVWLLLYLFGASPAVCGTFLAGREHPLETLAKGTLYLPYATSLRMGSIGYQSDVQAKLHVSYNDLEGYAGSLHRALTEPYPPYRDIGIREGDDYRQLSDSVLQIENEFYGTIRPKSPVRKGERTLSALARNGVEYVEVRSVDLDPYAPIGVTEEQLRFLDVFLLYCALHDSPPDSAEEQRRLGANQTAVVVRGREPGLMLQRPEGGECSLAAWANEILDGCMPIAEMLDRATPATPGMPANPHVAGLRLAQARVAGTEETPSARILRELQAGDSSFYRFAMDRSTANARAIRDLGPPAKLEDARTLARQSLEDQARVEAEDDVDFETYRLRYLASARPNTQGA